MAKVLIIQYYTNLDRAIQVGKSTNEQSVHNYYWNLLNSYAWKQNYEVIPEVFCIGTKILVYGKAKMNKTCLTI